MDESLQFFVEPGHFYSPICDPGELKSLEHLIWPNEISNETLGINYNLDKQFELLNEFSKFASDVTFPTEPSSSKNRYFYQNDQFPCLDAEVLFCFLRHLRPNTVIEIGSGFSSLVIAETNTCFFDGQMNSICIEPFPRQFLIDGVPGISSLLKQKLQFVPLTFFEQLRHGDVLFIDSSHVSKTGSDVNYFIFEILPRLARGVYIHIHDIFLPDEYPKKWAIEEARNWNEQYTVRAFLQFNQTFEIMWSSYLMATRYPQQTQQVFPRFPKLGAGGSLWLQKKH